MESFRKYLLASLLLQISTRHFSLFYTNCWVEKAGNFVRDVYFWSEMKHVLKLSETEIFFEQSLIMSSTFLTNKELKAYSGRSVLWHN